jgi:hypothetical protein
MGVLLQAPEHALHSFDRFLEVLFASDAPSALSIFLVVVSQIIFRGPDGFYCINRLYGFYETEVEFNVTIG